MRTNLVGRSWVSAITHTPASGPFGPVTTGDVGCADRGRLGREGPRIKVRGKTDDYHMDEPAPNRVHIALHLRARHLSTREPLSTPGSSRLPSSSRFVLTPCPPLWIRRPHPLSPSPHTRRGG